MHIFCWRSSEQRFCSRLTAREAKMKFVVVAVLLAGLLLPSDGLVRYARSLYLYAHACCTTSLSVGHVSTTYTSVYVVCNLSISLT